MSNKEEEEDQGHGYVCEGCRSRPDGDGGREDIDKRRETTTLENAKLLAKIHNIKTGHTDIRTY